MRSDRTSPHHDDPYGHLPQGSFSGTIHLVDSEAKALRAALLLRKARTVGLDTESRPSFRRGEIFPISLVQVATHDHAFLYRVKPGAPFRSLKRLIENARVTKIVQGAAEETRELRRDLGIAARGFVDLPAAARAAGLTEVNLRALAAAVLGIRISKSAQRSDWSRSDLSPGQLAYAATDAWACLAIHEKLVERGGTAAPPGGAPHPTAGEPLVREASMADAGAILGLLRELAHGMGESTQAGPPAVRAFLGHPGCGVLLAERAGQVVGMVSHSIGPSLHHGKDCCTIEELVVASGARRNGIGRMLLDAAIRKAARAGCAEVSVSTTADNPAAIALYRSAGLTDEALILERHLSRPSRRRGRRGGRRAPRGPDRGLQP